MAEHRESRNDYHDGKGEYQRVLHQALSSISSRFLHYAFTRKRNSAKTAEACEAVLFP